MTSLLGYLFIIDDGMVFHFKTSPKSLKPSPASVKYLAILSLLMSFNQAVAAPVSDKKLTSALNFNALGAHISKAARLSNQKLLPAHQTSLDKTRETTLDASQKDRPKRPIPASTGLDQSSLLQVNISRDPSDKYPPFDLSIQIEVQYLGSSDLTWGSTELTFPSKQTKAIGGASTCSNRPSPAFKLSPANTNLSYRLRSSNIYKVDFDWRLFEGRHKPRLRLYSKQNCQEKNLFHARTFEIDFIP